MLPTREKGETDLSLWFCNIISSSDNDRGKRMRERKRTSWSCEHRQGMMLLCSVLMSRSYISVESWATSEINRIESLLPVSKPKLLYFILLYFQKVYFFIILSRFSDFFYYYSTVRCIFWSFIPFLFRFYPFYCI